MDIHVDIRGFLEIHVWICYGFSDQGLFDTYLGSSDQSSDVIRLHQRVQCGVSAATDHGQNMRLEQKLRCGECLGHCFEGRRGLVGAQADGGKSGDARIQRERQRRLVTDGCFRGEDVFGERLAWGQGQRFSRLHRGQQRLLESRCHGDIPGVPYGTDLECTRFF